MSEAMLILLFLMFFLSNQDIERKNSIFQEMVINNENSFLKHLCKKSLILAWAQIQHVYLRKFSTFNLAKA